MGDPIKASAAAGILATDAVSWLAASRTTLLRPGSPGASHPRASPGEPDPAPGNACRAGITGSCRVTQIKNNTEYPLWVIRIDTNHATGL